MTNSGAENKACRTYGYLSYIQRSNTFKVRMGDEINKLKGDINSEYSKEIKRFLEQAKIKTDARINDINIRLFEVLKWATDNVELINLEQSILIGLTQ